MILFIILRQPVTIFIHKSHGLVAPECLFGITALGSCMTVYYIILPNLNFFCEFIVIVVLWIFCVFGKAVEKCDS